MNSETLKATVHQLVSTHGLSAAARMLRLHETTLTRILAGLPVRQGTVAQVMLSISSTPLPSDIAA
jgi:hypothetical protein